MKAFVARGVLSEARSKACSSTSAKRVQVWAIAHATIATPVRTSIGFFEIFLRPLGDLFDLGDRQRTRCLARL